MAFDIAGKEIRVNDFFVASRKQGNCNSLRFGRIVSVCPDIKTKTWMRGIGTLKHPDSILIIPFDMIPKQYVESILEE